VASKTVRIVRIHLPAVVFPGVGNVETPGGGRQAFGAVAKSDTDITMLISRNVEAVGRTDDTDLTAFTDGCSGLRSILAAAGVTRPSVLDWFHIAPAMT
jgi:hypothetical protein